MLHIAAKLSACMNGIPHRNGFPPIVLVDTFVFDYSFASGKFRDAYFADMVSLLPHINWWYIPTLFRQSRPLKCFINMRRNEIPFIIPQDYLKITDYVWAALHPIRMWRMNFTWKELDGYDVAEIFKEAMEEHLTLNSSLEALLKYRLAKRLKQRQIEIKAVVDWFENQDIDKGQNMGFRKEYPNAQIVGYQGFLASPNYLCSKPTSMENKAGVVPHRLAVMGSGLVMLAKEFCPDMEVIVAPAFRFQHLFKAGVAQVGCTRKLVVVLPFRFDLAISLIDLVVSGVSVSDFSIPVILKPHPRAGYIDRIAAHLRSTGNDNKFDLFVGELFDVLPQAEVIISTSSSTCMEAVCMGIPVIVTAEPGVLIENVVPKDVGEELCRICYTKDDIKKAMTDFINATAEEKDRRVKQAQILKEKYFMPVTEKTVLKFAMEAHLV